VRFSSTEIAPATGCFPPIPVIREEKAGRPTAGRQHGVSRVALASTR
jgi:hypothetical protein